MVDLVKIRKKSKDAKEAAAALHADAAPIEALAEPSSVSKAAEESMAPTSVREEPPLAGPESRAEDEVAPELVEPPPAAPVAPKKKTEPPTPPKAAKKAEVSVPEPRPAEAKLESAPAAPPPAAETQPEAEDVNEDRLARFKRLAGKRRTWTATLKSDDQGGAEEKEGNELELLRFRVAGENYAVDIKNIVEIVPPRSTTRVPNADEAIVGIISLRGAIVTVIDLRRKLGHPRVDFQSLRDARMIVVERAGETAGFLVDLVSRVVKLDPAQLENHPVVSSSEQSEYVSGVFQSPDGLVILLDIERILAG